MPRLEVKPNPLVCVTIMLTMRNHCASRWLHRRGNPTAVGGCTAGRRNNNDISVCRKLCNPWHSFLRLPHIPFVWGIRKFNPIASQLPKIEAIQTSLFVDVLNAFSAMTGPLPAAIRSRIVRLLLLHWQPAAIVEEIHCCSRTMYSMLENIFMYSSSFKSQFRLKEALRKVFKAAENGLIVYLEEQP